MEWAIEEDEDMDEEETDMLQEEQPKTAGRKIVTFQQKNQQQTFSQVFHDVKSSYTGSGVKVSQVFEDTTTEMNMVYDPSHPDADENGYVTYPNVNIITEMTDLIDASRSYEANSTAFNASKSMALKGLEIGQ